MGRLHVRAWQAAYTGGLMPEEYLQSLKPEQRIEMWLGSLATEPRPRFFRFVATINGDVVGFAVLGPAGADVDADIGELFAINVDPEHWGTGAGSALIDAGVGALRSVGFESAILWVHPDNERARRFYADRGWVADGVDRDEDILGVSVPETRLSLQL